MSRPPVAAGSARTCSASPSFPCRRSSSSSTPPSRSPRSRERPIKKVPTLRGKTVVNLFFEPSTRTRVSLRDRRASGSRPTSSTSRPPARRSRRARRCSTRRATSPSMAPDVVVIRHAHAGVPHDAGARALDARVINAGDGAHEHPTQALLDAFTIRRHKGTARRADGRDRRRHRAQPRGALEHPPADDAWAPACASPARAP